MVHNCNVVETCVVAFIRCRNVWHLSSNTPIKIVPLHCTQQVQLVGFQKKNSMYYGATGIFVWNGEADKSGSRGRRIPADNNWDAQQPFPIGSLLAASSSSFLTRGTTQYLWERSEEVYLGAFASMIAAHRSTARRLTLDRATKRAVVTAFLRCTTIRYIQDQGWKHERCSGRGKGDSLIEKRQRACYITCKPWTLAFFALWAFVSCKRRLLDHNTYLIDHRLPWY